MFLSLWYNSNLTMVMSEYIYTYYCGFFELKGARILLKEQGSINIAKGVHLKNDLDLLVYFARGYAINPSGLSKSSSLFEAFEDG